MENTKRLQTLSLTALIVSLLALCDLRKERGKPERCQHQIYHRQCAAGADDAGDCRPGAGYELLAVMMGNLFVKHSASKKNRTT